MKKYYATFGHGQEGFPGYVEITAPNRDAARNVMVREYGRKWSMLYNNLDEIHESDRTLRGKLS